MKDILKLRRNHLILLVGGNPLPNLVAARCLVPDGGHIWLLYTEKYGNDPGTVGVKDRLKNSLKSYSEKHQLAWIVHTFPIPSSDHLEIYNRILPSKYKSNDSSLVGQMSTMAEIGVHYTGGTKPMAVHVYRALKQIYSQAVFTYLDPRELALRVDRRDRLEPDLFPLLRKGEQIKVPPQLQISLEELAALHGIVQAAGKEKWAPSATPGLEAVWQAIMEVHTEAGTRKLWWDRNVWQMDAPQDEETEIAEAFADFPGVSQSVAGLCKANGQPFTLRGVADIIKPDHESGIKSCSKWFQGVWLEEYTWASVQQAVKQCDAICSFERNLLHKFFEEIHIDKKRIKKQKELSGLTSSSDKVDFELDIAFMLGYQLFALSCTTSSRKSRGLEHFFEVYVRACQLGGDEARFALVCCADDPRPWKDQLAREWDAAGKIHVFGAKDLKELPERLEEWYTALANKV